MWAAPADYGDKGISRKTKDDPLVRLGQTRKYTGQGQDCVV